MKPTLYHYVHCPFCVRVRMALGLFQLPYHSIVLPYDDEETPVRLTGKKMLPILELEEKAMNESLDIIEALDKNNLLKVRETVTSSQFKEFEVYLNYLGSAVHSLAMPYWIWTPEFNESSRHYFQSKKEQKRGPFKDLVHKKEGFRKTLSQEWPQIEKELKPFYRNAELGLHDILLAAHLWGLYVVPEFQFPAPIHGYLQRVKKACRFDYHQDFWR